MRKLDAEAKRRTEVRSATTRERKISGLGEIRGAAAVAWGNRAQRRAKNHANATAARVGHVVGGANVGWQNKGGLGARGTAAQGPNGP